MNMETSMHDASGSSKTKPTLLFVYNADTGLFSVMTDYAHKIISPKTYPCNLCAITYGNMGMNKKWKEYIDNLTIPIEFLHRDEFLKRYDLKDTQLPATFIKKGENIAVLIDHSEINGCTSVEELMDLVTMKIENVS